MMRRIPFAPAEGWLSLGCVLVICVTMALAIDDARWVLGRPSYLDNLVYAAIGGVLVGFLGPKVGWGRWVTYLVGSVIAALVLPILTGLVANPNGASIGELYQATANSVVRAYVDLAILDLSSTSQYLHYILSVGLLVWGTSMFASYAVFGHHRPLSGIVIVGVILVANMALTRDDQLPFLIVFSLASLFLLILSHAFDQQSDWVRRRIGEPSSISTVYLRGGSVFITVAVAASFLLTQTAASAPLAGAWNGVEDGLIGISRSLQRFLPTGGNNRPISLTFGPNAQIGQLWTTDGSVAATITRDPLDDGHYYWRAWTYDRIDLNSWGQSAPTISDVQPGTGVLDKRADNVTPAGRHAFTFTVTPAEFRDATVLSPQTPIEVDQAVRVTTVGQDGYLATIDRTEGNGAYTVTALTAVDGNDPGQLNLAALRATSMTYPQEVSDLYLGVAVGSLGPNAQALEAKIVAEAASRKPIDLANQLVAELHSDNFTYDTDIRDLDCSNVSRVECFATYRKGFCQYYAATMAVILRDLGVPTRIAEGFLPGARAPRTATEQILFSNAHAWVEVYFSGYGWVTFDPTGGNLSQVAVLPSGRPVASLEPGPSATIPGASRNADVPGSDRQGGPAAGSARGGSLGPLLGVGALLLLAVGGLAFVSWQRGPRGGTSADGAYGSVTRIASRFGFGPRPGQTVYEFAGALGDILPDVRPELETVARAKVESVYARQILGDERLAGLRAAQRRLRVGLLRLAFRRKERRRR